MAAILGVLYNNLTGTILDIAAFFQSLHNELIHVDPWTLMGGGILLGAVIVFGVTHRISKRRLGEHELTLRADAEQVAATVQTQFDADKKSLDEQITIANHTLAAKEAQLAALQQQMREQQNLSEQQREQLTHAQSQAAATIARLEEVQKGFTEKEKLFKETQGQMKQEFELLANRVFEAQGVKQHANLQTVLSPFKEQIGDFKKRVEEVYHSDIKERATLLGEIKNLQSASERINTEAENLTKALKGDKKLQGNWGELVLERVLEESGLRKDHEYFLQTSKRNDEGDLKRPDVLIQLPDNKDVVIDSKVSLNAYEEALAHEDEEQREQLLRTHLANLRNHVKRLSEQDYDQLKDVRSLDFVLLFIPIESAFTLAMELDQRLFTEAFTKRIVMVSPTTLMMTLRIINNVWRYEKQNRNAQEIARRAGGLYDKLSGVVEEMDKLGKQLETADKTYKNVYARLATGNGNLVRQVEKFRELGATVKKPMPAKLIDKAIDDVPTDTAAED